MDANDPGLFDLPDRKPPTAPERSAPGRTRETWARIATAEVTITDADAVREAAANAEKGAVTIGFAPGAEDEDDPAISVVSDAFDALAWLIWPTDGLDPLLEADAFRILSVDSEVEARSVDRGSLTWTVTIKLTNVHELRRVAAQAHPEQAASIADSLAVAWQCAADPFAPLHSVPGIVWQPRRVEVQHVPARKARNTRAT